MSAREQYILFIGMGDWDIPQVDIAKSYGLKTIITNRNKKSLGLKVADIPIHSDGRDIYKILSAIFENNVHEKILFVYTGTELFTTAGIITKALNIPWHSTLSSYICEKKHLMRKCFNAASVNTPLGFSAKNFDEFVTYSKVTKRNITKWVFKPSDSLSSQGVSIVTNKVDFLNSFNYALSYSATNVVICEEFISGSLHDINGIIQDNTFYPLGINDKKAGKPPHAVVVEGSAPTLLSVEKQKELYKLFEDACRSVGLKYGQVKGDSILSDKGVFYIMEVAPRLHGPLGSIYLIPNALNINPFSELVRFNLSEKVKTHNLGLTYSKFIKVKALENKPIDKNNIIKILEKTGIADNRKWESNNDVPCYVIYDYDNG